MTFSMKATSTSGIYPPSAYAHCLLAFLGLSRVQLTARKKRSIIVVTESTRRARLAKATIQQNHRLQLQHQLQIQLGNVDPKAGMARDIVRDIVTTEKRRREKKVQ